MQGYVYVAKLLIADLYSRSGDHNTAQRLRSEAQELKTRFNREFWLKDKDYYAMALQKEKRPAAVIGSNPGQALWSGIIDEGNAAAVVRHLMAADMFSGWGIRTLSLLERRANPVGYHLGSVWPHDNAIIAAGLHRYGFDDEAIEVLDGIVQAASHFEHYRLPEVFAGFSRREFPVPVRYPIACHPQAWAAGSVPFLITSVLGIVPDAFNGCIRIVRPSLPRSVKELHFRRIKLGTGSADILFRRATAGTVEVDARITGNVRVEVDHEPRTNAA